MIHRGEGCALSLVQYHIVPVVATISLILCGISACSKLDVQWDMYYSPKMTGRECIPPPPLYGVTIHCLLCHPPLCHLGDILLYKRRDN